MRDDDVQRPEESRTAARSARSDTPRRRQRIGRAAAACVAIATMTVGPALFAPVSPATADDTVWPGQTFPGDPAGDGPYDATWNSVDQHTPAPEWFKDAKFGIYWHWGAFAVPGVYNEWYPRRMYGGDASQYHQNTYGNQYDTSANGFGYDKFLTGGTDKAGNHVQFAPKLASEGGNFDPKEWIDMVAASGAKFAGPVAEHHDGYSMWDSQVNEWNSVDMGPKLDLLKIFADEIRSRDMKLVVSMHHAYNINGFFDGAPAMPDASRQKLFGQLPYDQANQLWYDKLREVLDRAQPDILWQDFGLDMDHTPQAAVCTDDVCKVDEQQRLNFLSYYFNQGEKLGKDVVATYKHFDNGMNDKGEVADYETGGPGDVHYPYWLTDDSPTTNSWAWTQDGGYFSSKSMLHAMLDRASKNGNTLLNIAPEPDGTIPQQVKNILGDIGSYLNRNGDAFYATRAWDVYGEGPTKMGGGSFVSAREGNAQDIRYTVSKDDKKLYATVLGWPGDNAQVALSTLAGGKVDLSGLSSVKLFGANAGDRIPVNWSQNQTAMRVQLPGSKPVDQQAYVIEMDFPGGVPTVNGDERASFYSAADGEGSGVSIPVGNEEGRILKDRGLEGKDIKSLRLGADVRVVTYESNDLTGTPTVYEGTAGSVVTPTTPIGSLTVENAAVSTYSVTANANQLNWDTNGATADGSGVVQKTGDGSNTQQWRFEPTSDGYFRLVNPATNLAITSPSSAEGVQVTLTAKAENNPAQEWKKTDSDTNALFVNRAHPNLVLDSGGGAASGAPLKQWGNGGSGNFRFTLNEHAATPFSGTLTLTATQNNLRWDANGSTASGSGVVQSSAASTQDQSWTFAPTTNGYYRIVNKANGRAVESPSSQQGDQLVLKAVSDSSAQQWLPIRRNGFWIFQNRARNNLVIDGGGGVASGSALKQWGDNGSSNFQFVVEQIAPQANVTIDTPAERAYGTDGTVKVTVTGTESVPAGAVTLSIDGAPAQADALDDNGVATFTVAGNALERGAHTLRAEYVPEAVYGQAVAAVNITITEAEPAPSLDVAATASVRCIAGKAYVAVQVKNNDDTAVSAELTSPFGTKTVASVAPGKVTSHVFTTRQVNLSAGEVSVTATASVDGQPVQSRVSAAYAAHSCG